MTSAVNRGQVDPGAEDLLRASSLVVAAGGDNYDVMLARLDGDPWSKSRPRHTRTGRTYSLPEDRDAEARTAARLREVAREPASGNVALACIFYRSNRQRIDADNLLKHVCDAANGVLWHDDSQVTAVLGVIELDPAHPRTVVAVAPHFSTLGRGADWTSICARCGREFVVNPKHTAAKYCGRDCSNQARGHVLMEPVPCATCQQPFRRKTTAQRFCCMDCRSAALRGVPRERLDKSRCLHCDRLLSHRRGGLCRDCWRTRKVWAGDEDALPIPGVRIDVREVNA